MNRATSRLRTVARTATRPARDYVNWHFESTKDEIRRFNAHDEGLAQTVAELANVVAETQLYHSRLVGDLRDQVRDLTERIDRFEATIDQLTQVLAAMTSVPEDDVDMPARTSPS
jgi:uncharacterized coiled-coil protein SlyX